MIKSTVHSRLSARNIRPFDMRTVTDSAVQALARIGIVMDAATVRSQIEHLGLLRDKGTGKLMVGDSAFVAPITQASIPTPIQFLQFWLPGFVKVLTAARKIDTLIGIDTVGSWEDQEIVQGMVEPAATASEYGDFTNIPLASWNTNFERRTIVRGEMGMQVGLLEEGRAAAMRLNSAETKRQAASVSLEMLRNAIGFFGWNRGDNRTFGFLNDPNLPDAISSSTATGWQAADFQAITGDIRMMIVQLRTQSQDQIDPEKVDLVLALPTNKVDYLSVTTDFGISVRDWIKQTYPKMRIESAPELTGAVAGAPPDDMAYLYAEEVSSDLDGSSDDGAVFKQLVQTKFMTLGVEKRAKSYVEDYANGTAGTMCVRPYAVVRIVGL